MKYSFILGIGFSGYCSPARIELLHAHLQDRAEQIGVWGFWLLGFRACGSSGAFGGFGLLGFRAFCMGFRGFREFRAEDIEVGVGFRKGIVDRRVCGLWANKELECLPGLGQR